jgi:site-specific DNA recombinase
VLDGKVSGGQCFGYGNNGPDGQHVIYEPEAKIVRRIFSEYAAGRSPREIVKQLNRERNPGPAGGNWGPTVIHGHAKRGTGLLNNRFYVGTEVWGQCTDSCGGSQPLIPTALYVVARMTAIRPQHQ